MPLNTKYRSTEAEIMDDFNLGGDELEANLDEIAKINTILGGNALTINGINRLIGNHKKIEELKIVDLGCGNGDMLRRIAKNRKFRSIKLKLIGVDANAHTISYANTLSSGYPNIEYHCLDIFSDDFLKLDYDIAISTLTLHHFNDNQVFSIMQKLINKATIGIVINDLQRSRLAYRLFQLISVIFNLSKISSHDGLTSILRGFKREELEKVSGELLIKKYSIHWKWAFRYQWIINTR